MGHIWSCNVQILTGASEFRETVRVTSTNSTMQYLKYALFHPRVVTHDLVGNACSHPRPSTLNPGPQFLNPQPQTPNPKHVKVAARELEVMKQKLAQVPNVPIETDPAFS